MTSIQPIRNDSRLRREQGAWAYFRRHWQKNRFYYFMITPLFVIRLVLYAYPVAYSVFLGFTEFDYARVDAQPEWVGLENFIAFFQSTAGRQIIRNTFVFTFFAVSIETIL